MVRDLPIEKAIDFYLGQSTSELTSTIELPQRGHNAFKEELGRGVRLCFFSVGDSLIPKAEFRLYEQWKICLEFEIYKSLKHVIAAVGVSTIDGIPLITYWSQPESLNSGMYKIEFICNIPLKAGGLTFVVGLSDYEIAFYYQQNIGYVSISEVSTTEQPFRSYGSGILLDDSNSKIEPIDINTRVIN